MRNFAIDLKDDYCQCDICHEVGGVIKFRYIVRDYESDKRKGYICKTLQEHRRAVWICRDCFEEMMSVIGERKDDIEKWREVRNGNEENHERREDG